MSSIVEVSESGTLQLPAEILQAIKPNTRFLIEVESVGKQYRIILSPVSPEPLNLAVAIERRFAKFGDFELPAIAREPLREPPNFEDLHC